MTATLEPTITETVEALPHTGSITVSGGKLAGVTEWNTAEAKTVEQARETFAKVKEAGYLTYATDAKGDASVSHNFDPEVEAYVATAPMQGG